MRLLPTLTRPWLQSLPLLCLVATAHAEQRPDHMVYLRAIDPTIEQDMRYAGAHNFTGHPLDGYNAAECLLTLETANALARVQASLRAQGYGLKVFDCYRPTRAVADMGRFATEPGDPLKAEFYPRVDKQDFWRLGYVARVSNHSRGSTVDLTLVGPKALPAATWTPAATQVDCTAPYGQRWQDGALDMGTGFDCFDERTHTANPVINATARDNRQRLGTAMEKKVSPATQRSGGTSPIPATVRPARSWTSRSRRSTPAQHSTRAGNSSWSRAKPGTISRASPNGMSAMAQAFANTVRPSRWCLGKTDWPGAKA